MRLPFVKRKPWALILGAALGAGCSSSNGGSGSGTPTLDGSLTQIAGSVCGRFKECSATFSTDFPNGTSDCVTQVKTSAEMDAKNQGRDVNAAAQCTQAQLDTCLSDINAVTCDMVNASTTLPASCQMKC